MRDFADSTYRTRKVAANRVKVQRQPINWGRYLRPLTTITLWLAGLSVVGSVAFFAYRLSCSVVPFRVKNIEISSTERLTREDVLAIAGVEPGMDLLRLNLKSVCEQLSRNPWVESVRVQRFFPDRISIGIVEREPVAVINMGYIYYLDGKGVVFKTLSQGDNLDYPVVTGFSEEDMATDPAGTEAALKSTCSLLKVLQEQGAFILADVSEIHYDKGFGFTLFTTSGGLPVKVGMEDFAPKVARFSRIYKELMAQGRSLQYIDLDYGDKIIVKKYTTTTQDTARGANVSSKKG